MEKGPEKNNDLKRATFAGGCFWCMQPPFANCKGVVDVKVGYTGGDEHAPTYEEVSSGATGHLEAVQVTYDPAVVSYKELVDIFWQQIDPTDAGGQFADQGLQYRTAIFYHDDEQKTVAQESILALARSGEFDRPIVTQLLPAKTFFPAEAYHQDYYKKAPLRYNAYKLLSGRQEFIKKHWGGK